MPVLIVPAVLVLARQLLNSEQVSLAVISLAVLGHHLPGFLRVYGDRQLLSRYPRRFVLMPPLVLAMALCFTPPSWLAGELHIPWKHLHGLELMLLAWGTWHGLRQTYRIARFCDIKGGVHTRWSARLDQWLCVAVFISGVVFSDSRVFSITKTMWESGVPIFGPEWLYRARVVVGVAGILLLATHFANLVHQFRAGQRVSWIKPVLIGMTGWFYWYTGRLSVNVVVGIAAFEIYLAVQEASVSDYNRRLSRQVSGHRGLSGILFSDRWRWLGVSLGAIGAYVSIRLFPLGANAYIYIGTRDAYQWLLALFVTSTFLHFYFNGFIGDAYKLKAQENLEPDSATSPNLVFKPALDGGGNCAAVLAIAGSLLLGLGSWVNESPSSDLRRLAALAALTPNLPEGNALLCRDALSCSDAQTAIIFGEKALRLGDGSYAAHADLGRAYWLGGRLDDARKQFEAAIEIFPDEWSLHCNLGAVLARLGDYERAELELNTAVHLASHEAEPHEQLAEFYFQQNRTAKAADLYELIAGRFPTTLSGDLGKIMILNRQGRHREAVELASFLAAANSRNWQVLLALGASLNAAGDPERGRTPLEQAVSLRPNSAEAHYQLGLAQFQLGFYPRTVRSLGRALRLDPNHFAAHLQLGNTYYVLGEVDAALAAFQRALDLQPGDATASANYGGLLAQLGMADEAEKVYRMALVEHGESKQLNYNLGILLWQKGEKAEAKKLILRAAEWGMQVPAEVREALQKVE
jgi:Flp pilus assembly protein TadD